jgi:hypothetical protein
LKDIPAAERHPCEADLASAQQQLDELINSDGPTGHDYLRDAREVFVRAENCKELNGKIHQRDHLQAVW